MYSYDTAVSYLPSVSPVTFPEIKIPCEVSVKVMVPDML